MILILSSSTFSCSTLLRFIALSLSYTVSLIIFQKGLLVKRHVLSSKSSCLDIVTSNSENCWINPKYNKSIILIIDALRYDFIFPYENCPGGIQKFQGNEKYYHGHMPNIAQLLREQPSNALLFPFIAEAPTTTFQRIKALVTGSVPAFIEAGDNFDGTKITEDNILDQLLSMGKNATLLGDETWLQLLPGRFHRHFEEPSFDIKDLDTVDNTVIANIFNEINRSDWSLIIAHCLGVDHAGHRYGPAHSEMSRKLNQMDQLILNLTLNLPKDSILFVLGDHGMTATGDHGGDSLNELKSALFVYTNKEKENLNKLNLDKFNCSGEYWNNFEPVNQVDLVPTLSLLLDLPIPFPNIGQIIKPIFGVNSPNLFQEVRLNAFQMYRYAQEYAKQQIELREPLSQISRYYESTVNSNDLNLNLQLINSLNDLIRSSLDQFNFVLCLFGIFSLIDCLLFNCFLIFKSKNTTTIPLRFWVFRSAMILLQLSLIFADKPTTEQIYFITASLLVSLCYFILPIIFDGIKIQKLFFNFLPLFCQLFLGLLSFSNSFIIYEANILRFSIQSLILIGLIKHFNIHREFSIYKLSTNSKIFIFHVFVVLSALLILKPFESCREEQVECDPLIFTTEQILPWSVLASIISTVFLLNDKWKSTKLTKFFVWPLVVFLCFHWTFDLTSKRMKGGESSSNFPFTINLLETYSHSLAKTIFSITLVHFLIIKLFKNNNLNKIELLKIIYQMFSLPLIMLVGADHGWKMSFCLILFPVVDFFFKNENKLLYWLINLFSSYCFFAIGNQKTLSSIPWRPAFILGNYINKYISGSFVLIALFFGQLLASLILHMKEDENAPFYLILFLGIKIFGSVIASLYHHRHLMFYKVFAPKFVFDGVELLICCVFNILIYLLTI